MDRDGPGDWLSVPARLPAALLPVGMLFAAGGTGSLTTTALMTSLAVIGLALSVPASGAAAERLGQRAVLLASTGLHVVLLVLVLAVIPSLAVADAPGFGTVGEQPSLPLLVVAMVFALLAGLTAPSVSAMSRARGWQMHVASPGKGPAGGSWMRREAAVDELLLVLSPLLVGLLSGVLGPGAGLNVAAVLGALAVPAYVMGRLSAGQDPAQIPAQASMQDPGQSADGPLEPLRVPLPAVEHGQQMVVEARGRCPERPAHPPHSAGRADSSGCSRLVGALLISLGLGIVVGGTVLMAWVIAEAAYRPGAAGLLLGLSGAAGMVSSRWLPTRFSVLDVPRRRRLFAVLLGLCALLLAGTSAVTLPHSGGIAALVVSAVFFLGVGASSGVLLVEVYRVVARRAPTAELVTTLSTVAGALLVGLVLGLCVAALLAETVSTSWAAVVLIMGGIIPVAVALRPGPGAPPAQGRASRTESL
ncbi:hypothetical protein [Nesterenkonia suensis]